ncbi:hypothetical protein K8I61_07655 [bacterium]|nr:hypothetical protein [bacterium]
MNDPRVSIAGGRHLFWLVAFLAAAFLIAVAGCGGDDDDDDDGGDGDAGSCDPAVALCTWAGNGLAGFDGDGHPLAESMLYWPIDVTFMSNGDAYIVDWNNHAIRKVEEDGTLRTVIGSGFVGDGPEDLSDTQAPGAPGTSVALNHPTQFVENPNDDTIVLVSWHNHKLRAFDPATEMVSITCGSNPGYAGDGGPAGKALLNQPTQVAFSPGGSEFILDMRNQVIRSISPDGVIETVAGTPATQGYDGDGGTPLEATFNFPAGSNPPPGGALAFDQDGRLYVSDTLNNVIRRIDFENDLIQTIAGTGEAGFGGDDGPATAAMLNNPRDLEMSSDGRNLYIADEKNHRVRAIDLETGVIRTAAGNGDAGYGGEGFSPTETALNRPGGVAFDLSGRLYIADTYNHRIRAFTPGD